MSMSLMAKAMSIKVGNPLRKLVLIKLADNANDSGECWPSYQHIADHCECSKTAVRNHIDALEEMGLIKRENRMGVNNGKGNASNVYYLNLDFTPVPLNSTGLCHQMAPPMPPDGTPPMPPDGTRTSHSFEPVKEPLEGKKKSSSMPEGFSPSESHHRMAKQYGVSLQEEFEKFTDHHLSKGSKFIDWGRALNTWLRNARDFQHSRPHTAMSKSSSAITVSKTGYVFFDR